MRQTIKALARVGHAPKMYENIENLYCKGLEYLELEPRSVMKSVAADCNLSGLFAQSQDPIQPVMLHHLVYVPYLWVYGETVAGVC